MMTAEDKARMPFVALQSLQARTEFMVRVRETERTTHN